MKWEMLLKEEMVAVPTGLKRTAQECRGQVRDVDTVMEDEEFYEAVLRGMVGNSDGLGCSLHTNFDDQNQHRHPKYVLPSAALPRGPLTRIGQGELPG